MNRASLLPSLPHLALTTQTVLRHSDGEATCQQTASLCGRFTAEDATVAEQTASLCGQGSAAGAEAQTIRMVLEGDQSPNPGQENLGPPAFPLYFWVLSIPFEDAHHICTAREGSQSPLCLMEIRFPPDFRPCAQYWASVEMRAKAGAGSWEESMWTGP